MRITLTIPDPLVFYFKKRVDELGALRELSEGLLRDALESIVALEDPLLYEYYRYWKESLEKEGMPL